MKTIILKCVNGVTSTLIPVLGMVDSNDGKRVIGLFETEQDARSMDADSLAIGTVSEDRLRFDDLAIAIENAKQL